MKGILILALFFLVACKGEPEVTNPNIDCEMHRKCGPDAICAQSESCYKVPGCAKTICLKPVTACEVGCGQSDCKVLESYPAQIQCF